VSDLVDEKSELEEASQCSCHTVVGIDRSTFVGHVNASSNSEPGNHE